MKQLLLVRHAQTRATQRAAFGADEPLLEDAPAHADAAALRSALPSDAHALCSPALRCRQTATALGLAPAIEPALAECDFGEWEGRTFAEVQAATPQLVAGWLGDPDAAPHGGESLTTFAARVGRWLDAVARSGPDATVAVSHAGVVKALVVHALGAPLRAFWRIEIAPLSLTELRAHDGEWSVARLNWTPA